SLDSSINTMERILSILHNAHSTKMETRDSVLKLYDSAPEAFESKNMALLGENIFDLKTIDILIDLQLGSNVDIFKRSNPSHARNILQKYISAFKDQYARDSSYLCMESLGRSYAENTRKANATLNNAIRRTASKAMIGESILHDEPPIHLDFCRLNTYNPFRNDIMDPFALQKGLSTKKHPANLFGAMINDQRVLLSFLHNLKKRISPLTIQNIMVAQSMFGNLALKSVVKRRLLSTDPRMPLDTPFEFYHLDITDENNKLKEFKAIVVYRSMILNRLEWFPPFRKSLAELEENKYDSMEKIIAIMADTFDRFFGLCFKTDAKYCDKWVENLMTFYTRNKSNEIFFQHLLDDAVVYFKEKVSQLSFETYSSKW
ncbi:hypothetical protein METBIDRAFT_16498, partial [Metschnikowia bicuspidata var. bicuspidata NRRL YB-4993]